MHLNNESKIVPSTGDGSIDNKVREVRPTGSSLDTTEENFKLIYKFIPELKFYSETEYSVSIDNSVIFDVNKDGFSELIVPDYLECKVKIFSLTGQKLQELDTTEGLDKHTFSSVPTGPSCRTMKVTVGDIYGDGVLRLVTEEVEFSEHTEKPNEIVSTNYEAVYVFNLPDGKIEKILKLGGEDFVYGDVLYIGDIDKDKKIDLAKYLSTTGDFTFLEEDAGIFKKLDSRKFNELHLSDKFYDQDSNQRSLTLVTGSIFEESYISLAFRGDKIIDVDTPSVIMERIKEDFRLAEMFTGKEFVETNKKIKVKGKYYSLLFNYYKIGGSGGVETPYKYQLVLLIKDAQGKNLARLTHSKINPSIQIKDIDNDETDEIVWIEDSRKIYIYKPVFNYTQERKI